MEQLLLPTLKCRVTAIREQQLSPDCGKPCKSLLHILQYHCTNSYCRVRQCVFEIQVSTMFKCTMCYWYNSRYVHEYQSNRVEVIIWKIMEWSIQVATGYQRVINWEGVELEIAIKSVLDLSTCACLIGQLVIQLSATI